MSRESPFHFVGTGFECRQQVAMAAEKVLEDVGELSGRGFGIECENPLDDMVGACLVGRVEIARLGRRLERPHDHSRRVWMQIERLPVQEGRLRHGALGRLEWKPNSSDDGVKCRRLRQAGAGAR